MRQQINKVARLEYLARFLTQLIAGLDTYFHLTLADA